MDQTAAKLPKIASAAIMVVGAVLFITYLAYLPMPSVFEPEGSQNIGLILYSLATSGAGFVAWGMILSKTKLDGISKQQVMQATGVGLGLLGLMRLGTSIFPHGPFEELVFVPISEFIVFTLLAIKFYKA